MLACVLAYCTIAHCKSYLLIPNLRILFSLFHQCILVLIVQIFHFFGRFYSQRFSFFDVVIGHGTAFLISFPDDSSLVYKNATTGWFLYIDFVACNLAGFVSPVSFWMGSLGIFLDIRLCHLPTVTTCLLPLYLDALYHGKSMLNKYWRTPKLTSILSSMNFLKHCSMEGVSCH